MSLGIINQGSIASVFMGQGSKAALTSAAATALIAASSMGVGCIIRVLDMSTASQITIGNSTLTQDASTAPGALILSAVDEGLTLNISGDIYGIVNSGSANLAITPLFIQGMSSSGG